MDDQTLTRIDPQRRGRVDAVGLRRTVGGRASENLVPEEQKIRYRRRGGVEVDGALMGREPHFEDPAVARQLHRLLVRDGCAVRPGIATTRGGRVGCAAGEHQSERHDHRDSDQDDRPSATDDHDVPVPRPHVSSADRHIERYTARTAAIRDSRLHPLAAQRGAVVERPTFKVEIRRALGDLPSCSTRLPTGVFERSTKPAVDKWSSSTGACIWSWWCRT